MRQRRLARDQLGVVGFAVRVRVLVVVRRVVVRAVPVVPVVPVVLVVPVERRRLGAFGATASLASCR